MKNILTILLCVTMILSFGACSSGEKTASGKNNNDELEEYITYYGDEIKKIHENAVDCKCEISVSGDEFIIDLYNNDKDNFTSKERTVYEQVFNSMRPTFRKKYMEIKNQLPPLEGVVLNILEKDGDLITRLTIDLT